MRRLNPRHQRPARGQDIHTLRKPAGSNQITILRHFKTIRRAFHGLVNDPLVDEIGARVVTAGCHDIISVDVAFSCGREVDLDGVVVEITRAFGGGGPDRFEAAVRNVQGAAVWRKGDAVGVVEGVFDDGDGAGRGAEAVRC